MNTTSATSAVSAIAFYNALRLAGRILPRFILDEGTEEDLNSAPAGNSVRDDEAIAIRIFTGNYSVGEPHGTQLDLARHTARVMLDPDFTRLEDRAGTIIAELSPAERELLRRWRNYERRAMIAREALRDLDSDILEKTENGGTPSTEECATRSVLVAEVEFWQRRSDNPQDFPIEVDQYSEEYNTSETLEELVAAQKADHRDWCRRAGSFARLPEMTEELNGEGETPSHDPTDDETPDSE